MDALPSLPDLTPDDRVWRLDWFGECAYPGGVRRYAQPSLKIALSPLRCDPSDLTALLFPDSTDTQHSHETWVPIAALPILAIGDLWQHGRKIASPDYQVESFKALRIMPENTAFVKAGLAIDDHFLLPLNRHPWHRLHTQSYCVAITLENGNRLLVPCVELIRFYFGSSSNFLQRLFTAPLSAPMFWADKRFNPANQHLHLILASRLSGASATDIGRIAESKLAWRSAAGIFASCQKAAVLKHPAYPYTGFPFEGFTTLMTSGTWLPFGDQEHATFLVYRLRSCTYPFPFQSLTYEAADRKAAHGAPGGSKTDGGKYSRSRAKASEITDKDAGANKSQRAFGFGGSHKFPDLLRKQVWREKIEAMPRADVFLRHADGHLEQVAFGEGDGYSDVAGVVATQVTNEQESSQPWFVQVGLRAIATNPEYAPPGALLKLVCPPGKTMAVFSLPVIIDEQGEVGSDLFFTSLDGSVRQRRACFVEVVTQAIPKYLLIVEGRTKSIQPKILVTAKPTVYEAALFSIVSD